MNWDHGFATCLQQAGVAFTAVLSVGALLSQTRNQAGRLTAWGKCAVILIIVAACTSLVTQILKSEDDARAANDLADRAARVDAQERNANALLKAQKDDWKHSFGLLQINPIAATVPLGDIPSGLIRDSNGYTFKSKDLKNLLTKHDRDDQPGAGYFLLQDPKDTGRFIRVDIDLLKAKKITGIKMPKGYRITFADIPCQITENSFTRSSRDLAECGFYAQFPFAGKQGVIDILTDAGERITVNCAKANEVDEVDDGTTTVDLIP